MDLPTKPIPSPRNSSDDLRNVQQPPPPLPPLVPPFRYACVEDGVYRGAYPSLINLRFLTRLKLRSMVSLVPEPPAPHLLRWCEENNVRNHYERVAPFHSEVSLTNERAAELLQLLVLPERQPVYVHCLDGVAVTGTLIMCLRKLQRWQAPDFSREFARFNRDGAEVATPPASHISAFLHGFKPELELAHLLPPKLPFWLAMALGMPDAAISTDPIESAADRAEIAMEREAEGLGEDDERPADVMDADDPSIMKGGTAPTEALLQGRGGAGGGGSSRDGDSRDGESHGVSRVDTDGGLFIPAVLPPGGVGGARVSSGLDALALEGLTMGPSRRAVGEKNQLEKEDVAWTLPGAEGGGRTGGSRSGRRGT